MPQPDARDRFLDLLRSAVGNATLVKLTLGKHRGADATLQNLFVRPVALKSGPHLAFVWRHATRDVTKNHPPAEALAQLEPLIGSAFLDAHLFTQTENAQLETQPDGSARVKVKSAAPNPSAGPPAHDRAKVHLIPADAGWLRSLGVMNDRGHPSEGMADKFRQIQKFAELLSHLLQETFPSSRERDRVESSPLRVFDMGSGKGYLTFAVAALLGDRASVRGIEARPELVALCNRVAQDEKLAAHLSFAAGTIADATLADGCDVLIALHACDTATDDALARGLAAGAQLLVVAPCCQKELRPQLAAPPVLAEALRHGIFQERQSEFVTDALRAQLLEWAGYRTKVFEFISTEHTAKNLMIAAIKTRAPGTADDETARRIREFARFYGIRTQRLATELQFPFLSSNG
ncbi:MAG TPA: SAM-dependent methyltransferase [Opitutaceae bacterium]|nr:SAM-dependent methyltransferase [Opitutaceae bacterium]